MRRRVLLHTVLHILVAAWALGPFLWAVLSSFKPSRELFDPRFHLFPETWTLIHYRTVFAGGTFLRNMINSFVVAGGTVILALAMGSLAAFVIARFTFPGRRTLTLGILTLTMFPQIAILSGLFLLLRELHLLNTHAGLVLSYLLFTLPFTVWVLLQYFRHLPRELEEAAWMDGASPWDLFWYVMLPLARPGLITTGLLSGIAAWNEFLFALTFTMDNRVRTVPVAIAFFGGASPYEIPWGSIMAASVVVTLPLILLVALFQRNIVEGLTAGAVRG